jgi:hypothetical protein
MDMPTESRGNPNLSKAHRSIKSKKSKKEK